MGDKPKEIGNKRSELGSPPCPLFLYRQYFLKLDILKTEIAKILNDRSVFETQNSLLNKIKSYLGKFKEGYSLYINY
jgi:hypothetical protein